MDINKINVPTQSTAQRIANALEGIQVKMEEPVKADLDELKEKVDNSLYRNDSDDNPAYQKIVPKAALLAMLKKIGGYTDVVDGQLVNADVISVTSKRADSSIIESYSIPTTVRNQYPLWSADGVYDSYEFDNDKWLYNKRIGLLTNFDNGTLYETQQSWVNAGFIGIRIDGIKSTSKTGDFILPIGVAGSATSAFNEALYTGETLVARRHQSSNCFYFQLNKAKTNVSTLSEAIEWMKNNVKAIAYVLAEPVVEDITVLMAGFDSAIEVEAGGSITFEQSNGEYLVPNQVVYKVNAIDDLVEDIEDVSSALSALTENVNETKSDISELKDDISKINDDIASIAGLKESTRTEGKYVKAKDGSIGTDSRFDVIEFEVSNCSFIRCTLDGTIPTSSAGFALYADDRFVSGQSLEGGRSLYLLDVDESITQVKMTVLAGKGYSVALGKNINDIQQEVVALSQQVEKAVDTVTRIPFVFTDENAYLDGDGRVISHNSYRYTEFVALKPFKKVVFPAFFSSGARCVLYDAGKNVISSISNSVEGTVIELDVPDNCYYMRFSCKKNSIDNFYIRTEDSLTARLSDMFIKEAAVDDVPLSTIIQDGGYTKIFRTMGVIGDSLASGEMAYDDSVDESTRQYVDMYEYSWIQYMARYCGSKAFNFSKGGMNTATFRRDSSEQYQQFIDPENKCQAYFIALGHNDYNKVSVGTIDDALQDYASNPRTFYGNYDWIINEIKRIQPKAKIFLVNMKNDTTYHEYNAAISNLAAKYAGQNVYLLDMAQYAPPLDSSWEYTKGHGNTMGYLNYSYQISSYVDWIIRHDRGDFKSVQFIGTDYE